MTRILALVATIPPRRASCERLLRELVEQSRPPDGVILCLDGYTAAMTPPAIPASLPASVFYAHKDGTFTGPGCRWRLIEHLVQLDWLSLDRILDGPAQKVDRETLLVSIDDDTELGEAPDFVRALLETAQAHKGAAAAMGYTPKGRRAAPGPHSEGPLLLGWGGGMALRAGHVEGLQALADRVLAAGEPDALGPLGDDQALLSAHLHLRGVPLVHAATGPIHFAPGSDASSQWNARKASGERSEWVQAEQIARLTGWPLAVPVVGVVPVPALAWEAELFAVPQGAVPARGEVRAGWRRVLVQDEAEPGRSGVYDVPG